MFRNGLLVLSSAVVHQSNSTLPLVIQSSAKTVRNLLYVHLLGSGPAVPIDAFCITHTNALHRYITDFYTEAARVKQSLEVRFLIGNVSDTPMRKTFPSQTLEHSYEVVLTDLKPLYHGHLTSYLREQFPLNSPYVIQQVDGVFEDLSRSISENGNSSDIGSTTESLKTYRSVVLGGAFDRLHVGHHILLTEGCLLATESLTVGVTQGSMNNKKLLKELMLPVEERIKGVHDFVRDIKPGLRYKIVPIVDVYGPAGDDANLECIVVSQETTRGASAVNVRRAEQSMTELDVKVIELVPDEHHSTEEEDKVSSSSHRRRLLGALIKSPLKEPSTPFIIGLTGGTASGKSSICTRLKGLGASVIDCDKLGHRAYEPGMTSHKQIVEQFGQDILDKDGKVDRKQLGSRVFSSKAELEKLNAIVWPAIQQLCVEEINSLAAQGCSIIVLDAAVLLEAGWDNMVDEIWTTIIPVDEAVRRLVDRNGLSVDDAHKRVGSQITNEQRVARANVVLCTLWEPEVTQKQVEKAWKLLNERIGNMKVSKTNFDSAPKL